jgi:hypothetical protein
MTRIFSLVSLTIISMVCSNTNTVQAQRANQNGVGRQTAWVNTYLVEKKSKATEWVYQINVNGTWTTVATASSRDMLLKQVIFKANHDQLPQGESRDFERLINSNWQFDSEHETIESARNRIDQIPNTFWETRVRTLIRNKTREELSQVANDYKIEVPGKPKLRRQPSGNGMSRNSPSQTWPRTQNNVQQRKNGLPRQMNQVSQASSKMGSTAKSISADRKSRTNPTTPRANSSRRR